MDYEKKYKEALEIAKSFMNPNRLGATKEELVQMFSELKESEDERIRKELIAEVREQIDYIPAQDCRDKEEEETLKQLNKRLAWLEKQGEQKPVEEKVWSIYNAKNGDVLNSERVQATIIFKGFADDGKHIIAYCALQKGIFISQELLWDRDFEPASEFWKNALYDAMTKKGYEWDVDKKELKKIERNPAWSEEDWDYYAAIIAKLEVTQDDALLTDNQMEFLRSLKNRVLPQPKQEWKPSDEQIRPLEYAIDYFRKKKNDTTYLESLYKDLMKLREE